MFSHRSLSASTENDASPATVNTCAAAAAAASALDHMDIKDLVGTIAGDDTAFLAMRDNATAVNLYKEIDIDKPIVFFDSAPSGDDQMYVKTDNYDACHSATRKMIRKGYQYFIIVSYNPYILQTRIERNKGCIDALEEKNIDYDQIILGPDADSAQLAEKLHSLLNSHKKICVFAMNSTLLQLSYLALEPYKERFPEIGLIGFDHEKWCEYVTPAITTISQPAYEEGYTAGRILLDVIRNENQTEHVQVLRSTLLERNSTALKK